MFMRLSREKIIINKEQQHLGTQNEELSKYIDIAKTHVDHN